MSVKPLRLMDDPAAGAGLRRDLLRASDAGVLGLDTQAGLAQLAAAMGAGSASAAAGTGGVVGKIVLAVMVAAGIGAVAWSVSTPSSERLVASAALPTVGVGPVPLANASREPVVTQTSGELLPGSVAPVDAPSDVGAVSRRPRRARAERARSTAVDRHREKEGQTDKKPSSASPTPDFAREAKLIADARRALRDRPARALRTLREAEVSFPHGMLEQERDALVVLALKKLGRNDDAARRAAAFLQHYSGGPYADVVRATLDPDDPDDPDRLQP